MGWSLTYSSKGVYDDHAQSANRGEEVGDQIPGLREFCVTEEPWLMP